MPRLDRLRAEVELDIAPRANIRDTFMARGYREHLTDVNVAARAGAIHELFTSHPKHIYDNDRIAGSVRGIYSHEGVPENHKKIVESYGRNTFITNADHFAPDYETALKLGIGGMLSKIRASMDVHLSDEGRLATLRAMESSLRAFSRMIEQYADAAEAALFVTRDRELSAVSSTCRAVSLNPPSSFREALQLVWLIHVSFLLEGRYAMALGRMDQYLYPYYRADIDSGALEHEDAVDLIACALYKIGESRLGGGDDVVNICIGGVKRDGSGGVNELSYAILEAVKRANIPGPNLSARIYEGIPDRFLDECLKVIGTGLGYPALMNDAINIPALHRHGYSIEDCRDYCMVGCIENFITGKQPPWSDGRFNTPKYLELALNDGACMQTGAMMGPRTGDPAKFADMEALMAAFKAQLRYGAAEYVRIFKNENERYNYEDYQQPYLSCYCGDCIARGLDINAGGAIYPSVHGAACMGIATVTDSLAAIEDMVFERGEISISDLRAALLNNYEGCDEIRRKLLSVPKYGNNCARTDRYAVWFVEYMNELFESYRTRDGGAIYTAMAANTQNISAGELLAASADGRGDGQPVSDAASPTYGRDESGPTAVINSVTRPDYTLVSCGTVLNQRFNPSMFSLPENRRKLLALIKVYFKKGGQEIQINSVSRDVLIDAMNHPAAHQNLTVRVSGFSARFVTLSRAVQTDILSRTEHSAIS